MMRCSLSITLAVGLTLPAVATASAMQNSTRVAAVGESPALTRAAKLAVDDMSLHEALNQLYETSGVPISFSPSRLPRDRRVSCRCESVSVAEALDRLLAGTVFRYREIGGLVLVYDEDVLPTQGIRDPGVILLASRGQVALPRRELVPPPLDVWQQAAEVAGTVVDTRSNPLEGVRVSVVDGAETVTDNRGRFRIGNLTGTQVTLRLIRIGYRPATQTARVGDANLRIVLTESVVNLDEVVVTGTAGGEEARSLGNAVGRVAVSEVVQTAPPAKLQDVLSVNVPGVRVIRASGLVGAGGTTRIRGAASLSLSNEPLIYVDGVRVNNQGAATSEAFQLAQESPSRLNDLNPEEIESIEVLKGPSAATIYGTEASNGVIQIITKRGRQGRGTFDVHLDGGANWLMHGEDRYNREPSYYIGRDGQIHAFAVLENNRRLGFPAVFSTGTPVAFGGSLSGGQEQFRYYFAADYARDEGAVDYNWQNKYNARANISYATGNGKFNVDLSLGAVRSRLRGQGFQAITNGITWACPFPGCEPDPADPDNTGWNGPSRGFFTYRPEDYYGSFGFDNIDRTTFSLKLTHRPLSWLQHRLTIGPDLASNTSSLLVERDGTGYFPFYAWSQGYKSQRLVRSTYLTVDYGASADWKVNKALVSTTSVGTQYYYKQFQTLLGVGQIFSVPGQSDITGSVQRQSTEDFLENKTLGVYAQEQVAWNNRVFLTAAVRGDDNSAFGENFSAVFYPKFSASWVVSEESFLANSNLVSQLRLRAAWGRAGQQPDVFSAIQTYTPKVGQGGSGGVSPQNIGNPDLKPEVGEEFEAGFDLGLFRERVGVEFSFYNKDIKDAILSVPLKPSSGFPGNQFVNIGKTRNRGIELGIYGSAVETPNVGLDLRATFSTNDATILDLGGIPPSLSWGLAVASQYNVEGFAPASFFFKRVLSSRVERINVSGVMLPVGMDPICEGGTDLGEGNGTQVPCATAPRIYWGRPTPSWMGSFSTTLTLWRRLRLYGLIDYLGGGMSLVGDAAFAHAFTLNTKAVLEGNDPVLSGYIGNYFLYGDQTTALASGLFNNGFAKLRTISAAYDFPATFLRRFGVTQGSITLSGENLATLWREQEHAFGRGWPDPEVAANRPSLDPTGTGGYTQESWPQLARVRATLRLTF